MINCPICKGTGKVKSPTECKRSKFEVKKKMILKLRNAGYSLRKIAKELNIKSVSTVQYYLSK